MYLRIKMARGITEKVYDMYVIRILRYYHTTDQCWHGTCNIDYGLFTPSVREERDCHLAEVKSINQILVLAVP